MGSSYARRGLRDSDPPLCQRRAAQASLSAWPNAGHQRKRERRSLNLSTVRHLKKKWCQTSHHTYKHTPYHYHHLNDASIKTENTYKECMHTESLQSCPTLCDPMGRSLPGSSVPEILQARILEWVAVPSSRESFRPRDQTLIA